MIVRQLILGCVVGFAVSGLIIVVLLVSGRTRSDAIGLGFLIGGTFSLLYALFSTTYPQLGYSSPSARTLGTATA